MRYIEEFLAGKIDVAAFMTELRINDDLHDSIQELIPSDAISNSAHPYWDKKSILRSGLECYDFNVRNMLFSHYGYGESESDQLAIFNTIRALYLWHHPDFRCTKKYEDELFFYLDLENDCFGGPEVINLVKSIAQEYKMITPKSKRKKEAKARVFEIFHVSERKIPRWVQGPQWPMGINSPMKFISQKRQGNVTMFTFMDIDTGAIKVIEQRY